MSGGVLREVAHPFRPTGSDLAGKRLGLGSELLQVAMLEPDARAATAELLEKDFDFHQELFVEAELVIQLPAQQQASGRIPGEHLAPGCLRALGIPLEPAPVPARFDDDVGVRVATGCPAAGPPRTHVPGEQVESPRRRGLHLDAAGHSSDAHRDFSFSCSASANAWNASSALTQCLSSHSRMAPTPRGSM